MEDILHQKLLVMTASYNTESMLRMRALQELHVCFMRLKKNPSFITVIRFFLLLRCQMMMSCLKEVRYHFDLETKTLPSKIWQKKLLDLS